MPETDLCKRIVAKGLEQSLQIKENPNPITQNFIIGKRGRPPKFNKKDKITKQPTKKK